MFLLVLPVKNIVPLVAEAMPQASEIMPRASEVILLSGGTMPQAKEMRRRGGGTAWAMCGTGNFVTNKGRRVNQIIKNSN